MSRYVFALLIGLAFVAQPAFAQAKKQPNILYIMSDDHAAAATSCYPSFLGKYAKTPNIDRIAKGGVRFTNSLVTNSICTPSRAAMLTGQYSHKNGVYTLADQLDAKVQHLGHMLRSLGYQTGLIGKWHLGIDPTGFDSWNVLPGQGAYNNPTLREMGKLPKEAKQFKGYSEDVITDLSLEWLKKRDKSKPFFLCVHFKAPHRPWVPAARFKDMYKDDVIPEPPTLGDDYKNRASAAGRAHMRIGEHFLKSDYNGKLPPDDLKGVELRKAAYQTYIKNYLRCVAAVDENVGRLLDYLDEDGIANDTVVVYTSDQGFFIGEHGWYDKRFMYEPCLTTPHVVRYPAEVPVGKTVDAMVINVDHAPTFLDYAGKPELAKDMDGKSYRKLLKGERPPDWRTSAYYRYWMHLGEHAVTAHYGVRTDRYTLIYYYGKGLGVKGAAGKQTDPEWELFDRQTDPNQMKNVVGDPNYRTTVAELKTELERLRKELGDSK